MDKKELNDLIDKVALTGPGGVDKIKKILKAILEKGGSGSGDVTQEELQEALAEKQDVLESGATIKTINNISILGQGNIAIPKGEKGDIGDTPNFTVGNVTTGEPNTPVVVTITGTKENPVLNFTIPKGLRGEQGDTGVSADYPITVYNRLDSDATDQALSAAQGKVLDGKVSQLQQKLGNVGTELTLTPSALLSNEGFITRTNGRFSAASGYYSTDYIDISSVAGQTCKMKSTIFGYAALAFYTAKDENAYISDWNVNNIGSYGYATEVQQPVERELPVPATAKYARMSVFKTYYTSLDDLYIKGISTVAEELSALKDKVAGLEDLPDDVTALETAQGDLLQLKTDVKTSLVGAINSLVPEGMQSVTGTMTGIYNYIQILTDAEAYERVTVVINSLSETPNAIQLYGKNSGTYELIKAFPNFSGIEVQLLKSYEYVYVLVVYNPSKTFDYNISYSIEPEGNVLTGKKVLVIGDSISTDSLSAQYFSDNRSLYPEYGNYSSYGNYEKWVYDLVMARYFPRNVENNSISATGFVRRFSTYENDFVSRIKKVTTPSSYDLVVVFGGTNDYISNIPLGESGDDVETYFKPAVDEFFAYLSANFINARIVVLTPLRTSNIYPNTTGAYQQQYSEYIKTVSENYAIPVLDLTKGSGFMPFVPAFGAAWTFHGEGDIYPSGDGVHPTQTYEEQFLAPQIRGFLEMQI